MRSAWYEFAIDEGDSIAGHARVWGSPGEGARTAGMLRMFWPVLVLTALIGFVLGGATSLLRGLPMAAFGLALLVLAALMGWVIQRCRKGYALFLKGARGEEQVARILGYLPMGNYVFHSLQLAQSTGQGAGDFDHVVVGPGGVFVIETKNWSGEIDIMDGKIFVDGEATSFSPLEQVKRNGDLLAEWVREREKVTPDVHRVLCFVSSELPGGSKVVDNVTVCGGQSLLDVLNKGDKPGAGLDGVHTRVLHALQAQMKRSD